MPERAAYAKKGGRGGGATLYPRLGPEGGQTGVWGGQVVEVSCSLLTKPRQIDIGGMFGIGMKLNSKVLT